MDKSPLPKRQKLTEMTGFYDFKNELERVMHLRKKVGLVVENVYSIEISALPQDFTKVRLALSDIENYDVPDLGQTFQCFRTLSNKYDETVHRICEHISLLNILEQKKNCPIAKMIDDI